MKTLKKIFLIYLAFEILRFIVSTIYTSNFYDTEVYSKESYFYGTEFHSASLHQNVVDLIKKDTPLNAILEESNNDELVFTSLTYLEPNDKFASITIYNFQLNQNITITQSDKKLDLNAWNYIFYGYNLPLIKGGLKINSLEYFIKGEMSSKEVSLNDRLQTFVLQPNSIFEIGFNNDLKRMIYIDSKKMPVSITFYQKDNLFYLIILRSENKKITANSIENYIDFD